MKRLALLFVLALPLMAETQKPFDPTTLGFHVAYVNGRVAPEVDLAVRLGNPVAGFTPYSVTGFAVQALKGTPVQLQATAVTGAALVRPVGEYVYFGVLGQGGVTNNGKNTGMIGKADVVAGYRLFKSQHWSVEGIAGASRSPLGSYLPEGAIGVRYGFNAKVSLPTPPAAK